MSVVKINAISVPEGAGPELEQRFAARAGAVDQQPGFEEFMLLRPTSGDDRYFVVTRWESEDAFQAWRDGQAFAKAHGDAPPSGEAGGHPADHPDGDAPKQPPVATGASLLEFDVVSISHPAS